MCIHLSLHRSNYAHRSKQEPGQPAIIITGRFSPLKGLLRPNYANLRELRNLLPFLTDAEYRFRSFGGGGAQRGSGDAGVDFRCQGFESAKGRGKGAVLWRRTDQGNAGGRLPGGGNPAAGGAGAEDGGGID